QRERATELAAKMGFEFDWESEAGRLSPAGAQKLEIVKLLWRNSETMVLDEPTAMLSPSDSEALYASLRQLAKDGATVIVVTHRIPEVIQHCDSVTVLRGGKKVADRRVSETDASELAELIVGHEVSAHERHAFQPGDPVLEVRDLVVKGARKEDALKGATFTIREGEVVGLAGVDGNGQRELFHALVGTTPVRSGTVHYRGRDVTSATPRERLTDGVRLIPEDRHAEGVIEDWNLIDNGALGLQRIPPLAQGALSDLGEREKVAQEVADRFKTKHAGLRKTMRSLSGGNQQRFVAARALELDPLLLLAFQPTRGLDIDGAAQVYAEIQRTCRAGACALVVSYDLDELLEFCDRTIVIHGGVVFEPSTQERQEIGRLMVGTR
ncbi:MAG TPA: ATP-binding cassette domain-containing protein, partial [Fimbriimonadaceae bacterium]|nr:ATP-binding cassette domain-containing protein [Fimbriimonadaceae bacterium]